MSELQDPQRLIGDIVRQGIVASVDLAAATCRVEIGDILTGDIPWREARAGKTRTWSPPSVGEQCLVLSPEGDLEGGIVVTGLFTDSFPAPSAEDVDLITFADGARISYDAASHKLTAILPGGGSAEIEAPGGILLKGNVTIEGNVAISGDATTDGTITGDTDVIGGGKSLKGHKHLGVTAGGGVSGAPQ